MYQKHPLGGGGVLCRRHFAPLLFEPQKLVLMHLVSFSFPLFSFFLGGLLHQAARKPDTVRFDLSKHVVRMAAGWLAGCREWHGSALNEKINSEGK